MKINTEDVLFIYFLFHSGLQIAEGACTFPSDLHDGTWHSSDMGDVTFNSTHFTVSQMVDFGSLTFACVSNTDRGYYSESESFSYLGVSSPFKVAICFKMWRLSSTKYIYYPQTTVLANTDVNRIFFHQASYSFSASETCDSLSSDIAHTRLLVKAGYSNISSVDCANAISGRYMYDVAGSTCTNTSVDVCTDKNEVSFNYTYCTDVMAYSAGGKLSCMYNSVSGGRSYVLLYNEDSTTDESTYYRFTCLVSKVELNSTYVTSYPRACLADQNASAIASPGVAFTMSANYTCKTEDSYTTTTTTTLSAGAAVAIVVALLILLAAGVVIGIWYYIKVYKLKKVNPDMIASKSPPVDTKEQERNLDGRVSPFSPFPTVSELALYRFGPSEIDDDDGGMTLEATTPGFTDGRRTMYGKDVERESQASLPVYSEVGGETPEPTRLSEVHTRMSEISEVNIADPTPFTMTRATMNIPEETRVSPLQTPTENRPNGTVQSPRENGSTHDVTV